MIFARKIWKVLVALKDGMVMLFLLLFFMGLYALLSAGPAPVIVQEGALLIKIDGSIVEEPAQIDPLKELLASSEAPLREYRARDLVRALNAAAKDDRIKAVVLDLSRFSGAGQVTIQEVGRGLEAVRKAKKPVLTYATIYTDSGVRLASHASEIWVDPLGGALISGMGGNRLYYGQLLEKLKITPHVFRVGTYKSAVEPYIASGPSPASREAEEALYSAVWNQWKADVEAARPKVQLSTVLNDPVAWLMASKGNAAEASKASGLVDRVGDKVAFGARVAELVGKDPNSELPGTFAHTALRTWLSANPVAEEGRKIAVVTVAGAIVDGKAGPGTAGGERIARLLDQALVEDYAALVVRVDSPGGSVMASEQIRLAVERHKTKGRPVVVSMANYAASGGYWVSTPASRIFAEPSTITGSIGIFSVIPSFERALSDIGVHADGVKTTPLSGQPDVLGGFNPEVTQMLQANIENGYDRFLSLVAASRKKSVEEVNAVAQGRVWDGQKARELGLVDEIGDMQAALAYAATQAKVDKGRWYPVYLSADKRDFSSLMAMLFSSEEDEQAYSPLLNGGDLSAYVADRQKAMLRRAFQDAERLASMQSMQAYCVECQGAMAEGEIVSNSTASLPFWQQAYRWLAQ